MSAIEILRVFSFEIDDRGNAVIGTVMDRSMALGSNVTQGPVTILVPFNNFRQLTDGNGYRLTVSIYMYVYACSCL